MFSNYINTKGATCASQNIPTGPSRNIPLSQLGQCSGGCRKRRRYTRKQEVEKFAVDKYNKNGKGITFNDLISAGLASHKEQAQTTLKHCLKMGLLFSIGNYKPQLYYPTCLQSEISKAKKRKNIPVGVTEVGYYSKSPGSSTNKCSEQPYGPYLEGIAIQSLEGYVLPLLPSAPLFIHKMHFKLKVTPECYRVLDFSVGKGNGGKEHVEVIGKVRVNYRFYSNGTVMVFTESNNNPFKLENEDDRSRLVAFFGQIKDRLVTFLSDLHERIVPDIMQWELTQFDINRDIKVSDWLQYTGAKIQVKHLDHLFRIYIKSIGKDTVCRVEESVSNPKKSAAIEIINNVFNPVEKVQKQIEEVDKKVDLVLSIIGNAKYNDNPSSNTNNKKGGDAI